jgi:hypothetical protein
VMGALPVSRESVHEELGRTRLEFLGLIDKSSADELRRRSDGTRWTNGQLLFHMLLGYLVVRTLLPLVRMFSRLPDGFSRAFAGVLNAMTRPFHVINYLGGCAGALVLHGPRLTAQVNRTTASLQRQLEKESVAALNRGMAFPVGWDPFFTDRMTLLEVYHYGTQHFEFHRRQLTLPQGP